MPENFYQHTDSVIVLVKRSPHLLTPVENPTGASTHIAHVAKP